MESYAGIDLHSTNSFVGIIDKQGKPVFCRRLENDIDKILSVLKPYKEGMETIVVESTYNWYWLVDALQEDGYTVRLANPSAIKQYEGLKHTDDQSDALWLAEMERLGILPVGYIYPIELRSVRDMLRRRLLYVRHRTAHILSLQSMITRNFGLRFSSKMIKSLDEKELERLTENKELKITAKHQLDTINALSETIKEIESHVLSKVKLRKEYKMLLTIPGIGIILGLTIMLEIGDISRFKKVGNYSSYCRTVTSSRQSNQKKKGENNKKNGNKYLAWAYVEAANFAQRYCPEAQRFYQRKKAKKNGVVAIKALSNKLTRASYYIIKDQVPFDVKMLFG